MKEYTRPELDIILFQSEDVCNMDTSFGEVIEDPE